MGFAAGWTRGVHPCLPRYGHQALAGLRLRELP